MSDQIQKIKDRLDIVEVIKSYIKLDQAGANYKALCPFHSESNPSFFVSPSRQIFKCFGCGSGGDLFEFVKQIEGVEFGDALRMLAKRAGVELEERDPRLETERKKLYQICDLSCQFFQKQLKSKAGEKAQDYLLKRGLTKQSIKDYKLGYAPDSWTGLLDFLVSKGYRRSQIKKAGLALESHKKPGSYYDRFRGRVMFPVFNLSDQVLGFGGRILPGKQQQTQRNLAKYMNTPNTLLYDKSRILYNLNQARVPIRKNDFCLLVEGYFDVILSAQSGMENIVASSGTALTSSQLRTLKRYSDNLYIAFDPDTAGSLATKRGINSAQVLEFNIKVVSLPGESDPADLISEDAERWKELIQQSRSILQFYFDSALSQFDAQTLEGKKNIGEALLPPIKRIPSQIEQSVWVQKLAKILKVKEDAVWAELEKINLNRPEISSDFVEKPQKSRPQLLQERVIMLGSIEPQFLDQISDQDLELFDLKFTKLIKYLKQDSGLEPEDPELKEVMDTLALKAEVEQIQEPEKEFEICWKELQGLNTKRKLSRISDQIKQAEQEQDFSQVKELLQKFNSLAKKIR